jgi:hypothetical protein
MADAAATVGLSDEPSQPTVFSYAAAAGHACVLEAPKPLSLIWPRVPASLKCRSKIQHAPCTMLPYLPRTTLDLACCICRGIDIEMGDVRASDELSSGFRV